MYVCMYACICVMYVCMYVCIYVCICMHVYIYIYVCMHVYVYMYACIDVCIYVCMYICIYVCMYVCMHICVCVCVCVCMYVKYVFQFSIKRLLETFFVFIIFWAVTSTCAPKQPQVFLYSIATFIHFQSKLEYVDNFSISDFIKTCKQFPGFFRGYSRMVYRKGVEILIGSS